MVAVMAFLALLASISCSPERPEGQGGQRPGEAREDRSEAARPADAGEPSEGAGQPEPPASLVPIAHLTSLEESVSVEELSQAGELAVPRGSLELAEELLGRPGFHSFDSADAVLDHVSRNPEAMGLVPWSEVDPRVKALAVGGESLLEPGATSPEDYPLLSENTTVPEFGELRRVVVGGDIVLDRGQSYMVIQQGMGLDFPLDGGYAAVTSRVPEASNYSETGVIHQFTAERRGGAGEVREYLHSADLTLADRKSGV